MKVMYKKFIMVALALWSPSLFATPFSDLSLEDFERGPSLLSPTPKSPFEQTSQIEGKTDVNTLTVQGIVYGKGRRIALVSGKIVFEGDDLGTGKVAKIEEDKVVMDVDNTQNVLKLENYISNTTKIDKDKYQVEFRNATLKDAVTVLAKGAELNFITPEDFTGRVTLSFDNITLMEALRSILRVNNYEYATEAGILRIGKMDAFSGGTDLKTQSFKLKYATAKLLMDQVKLLISDRGTVGYDERSNIITVKDRDAIISNVANLIDTVDHKDQQVRIEARIVDASRNFSRSLGIQWGVSDQSGRVHVQGINTVGSGENLGNPLNVNLGASNPSSGLGMAIGNIIGNVNLEAQLTASEQKGDIQILSKPSVTTLNNMPANIRSGTKIYVKAPASTSTAAGATGSDAGLKEISTGIELTVTPQISIDQFIKMKIDAVESEADFSRTVDGVPSVIDNTASTTVLIKDMETTVIGGLYRQKVTKEKKSVPGLGSVPVMGYLFSNRSKTKSDSELIIFITPKIIQGDGTDRR